MERIIKLDPLYKFEGEEYADVDLSGLEGLTGRDMAEADTEFTMSRQVAAVAEMSAGYCFILAAKVTRKPVLFFEKMPARQAMQVKTVVSSFLLGAE